MTPEKPVIFDRPYRMPVINALKKAVNKILNDNLPENHGISLEVGCGSGFFYRHLLPERFRNGYIGIDPHNPSLTSFMELAPEARTQMGSINDLPFVDQSVDVVFGFSVYPILGMKGAVKEVNRVLRPEGKLVVFQDSGIGNPNLYETAYDQMKRVEVVHHDLLGKLIEEKFTLIAGVDVLDAAVVSPVNNVRKGIPVGDLSRMPQGSVLVAFSSDLGHNRLHHSLPGQTGKKLETVVKDLGSPKVLQDIKIRSGRQALEYVRLRYLVAQKPKS